MGHHRPKTPHLGEKLREIRKRLGLTQNELVEKLGLEADFDQERISKYERAVLEPPIYVLIAYSDLTRIPLDIILRPEHDIPNKIPSASQSAGVLRGTASTQKKPKKGRKKGSYG